MASSELPPSKKKSARPAPTTISSLSDDLLCEVFLRLASLRSLVRAALTCRAFLSAVCSSPAFRRRFRDLHSAPLLGVFLDTPGFRPICRQYDLDHAAAVQGADVFLARVPDLEDKDEVEGDGPLWPMTECRDGGRPCTTPYTGPEPHPGFPAPPKEVCDPEDAEVEFHVVTCEEDRRSFRVVLVSGSDGSRAERVAVFSPDSREWQIAAEAGSPQLQVEDNGTLVNGCVYWADGVDDIHVLNAATLQFSRMDPPPTRMGWQQQACKYGETRDGKLCMAWTSDRGRVLDVSIRRADDDDDGVQKWMPGTTGFEMLDAIDELKLPFEDESRMLEVDVVAIIRGTVYLSTFDAWASPPAYSGWFLSFCIETEELKKIHTPPPEHRTILLPLTEPFLLLQAHRRCRSLGSPCRQAAPVEVRRQADLGIAALAHRDHPHPRPRVPPAGRRSSPPATRRTSRSNASSPLRGDFDGQIIHPSDGYNDGVFASPDRPGATVCDALDSIVH
ncbi:hypothetical protein VPH35_100701 [Triticum aestivum]